MNKFEFLSLRLIALLVASIPGAAYAGSESIQNPLAVDSLVDFLRLLLDIVAMIGFPIIVLFIIYIGFQFIASEGNAEKLTKVRRLFFWALVGALIVLGAQALSIAIQGTVEQLQTGL